MAAYTTIDDPSAYFKVQLYTGNATDATAITFDDTDTDMQPDFVWIKNRSASGDHSLTDSVRGVTKTLISNGNDEEQTYANGLQAFSSDGFTVGTQAIFNGSGNGIVAWCWKAGTTASGTTTGSGTGKSYSSSYNSTSGFQITAYTGNGSAGHTIPVGLSSAPNFVICKTRAAGSFIIYHSGNTSAPETEYLEFDTGATTDNNGAWNDVAPTSSVVTLGTFGDLNTNDQTNIMYAWSEVQGFSKFGSYVGNGNADGPMIFLGFRPAFILTKRTDGGSNYWTIWDNKRDPDNWCGQKIYPNATNAEQTESTGNLDFVANGVKIRNNGGDYNGSGQTYIYAAFAEAPLVNSNGVPATAR